MADEVKTPAPVPAPQAAASPSPAAQGNQPIEPAKAPEPVKAAEPSVTKEGESLLGAEPTKGPAAKAGEALAAETKIADAKEGAKPAEAKPGEAAPIEYKFKLPEGVTLDDKELGKFTAILGKHHASPEQAQELMDLYTSESQALLKREYDAQMRSWSDLQEKWISEIRADPEIGGNRIDTVLQSTRNLVEQFGGTASEKKALREMLGSTGAGNHPAMARFLYRVSKALGEGSPVPAPTPQASPERTNMSRAERRYGARRAQG